MRFDGFVLAVDPHPEPQRRRFRRRVAQNTADADHGIRSGLAFSVLTAPRVNAGAWFGLALAAPGVLLAAAAAVTMGGLAQAAGACAALLLVPAVLWALRAVEVRRFRPAEAADPGLTRAFCITIGQACGLLFVVMLGAPFTGQAVALGLAMAGVPLAVAVTGFVCRGLFRPVEAEREDRRDWLGEWAAAQPASAPAEPGAEAQVEVEVDTEVEATEPPSAPVVPFPTPVRVTPPRLATADAARPRRRAAARG